MNIDDIINAIKTGDVRVSDHAKDEAKNDSFFLKEIFFSVFRGEIIEDYPKDKPYPSCLIRGCSENGRHIHSVWAYNLEKYKAILITVYEPDPKRWIDFKKRK